MSYSFIMFIFKIIENSFIYYTIILKQNIMIVKIMVYTTILLFITYRVKEQESYTII